MTTEVGKKNNREYEYDVMRVVAALAVVIIHVCAPQWKSLNVYSTDWTIMTVWDMICKFSVPLFFMISGRFNLDSKRQIDTGVWLKKRISRIVIAFIFWSCVYTAVNIFRSGSLSDNWKLIVIEFFTGEYHMWYLFAIIGLYLATPLLKPIVADDKKCKYFLLLFFIFQLLLPAVSKMPHVGVFVTTALEKMSFYYPLGFTGYYVLGYYLKEHQLSKRSKVICFILGIIGTLFSVVMVILISRGDNAANESMADYLTWNVAAQTIAVYIGLQQLGSRDHKHDENRLNIFSAISKYSFGIYLAHPLILWIFEWIGLVPTLFWSVVSVPIIAIAATVLSFLLSWVLRKVPKIGSTIT